MKNLVELVAVRKQSTVIFYEKLGWMSMISGDSVTSEAPLNNHYEALRSSNLHASGSHITKSYTPKLPQTSCVAAVKCLSDRKKERKNMDE